MFSQDFREFIELLIKNKAEYLIVGGYAVGIIQLGYPPLRIDLLTEIDGVAFEECFKNRKEVTIDDLTVNFIGYDDLLKNKKKSGRPRDIDDIDHLK